MGSQADLEKDLDKQASNDQSYHVEFECSPPEPCTEFQTARLILSHLGFLSIPALRAAMDSPVPRLVVLENDSDRFIQDLESLDRISSRTHDTMLVYYVRSGQTRAEQIVANARCQDLSSLYIEMLSSLGWPVGVAAHPGWTGDIRTSWRVTHGDPGDHGDQETGPAKFSGDQSLLYWADVTGELAILVPASTASTTTRPSSAQGAAFLHSEGPDSGGYDQEQAWTDPWTGRRLGTKGGGGLGGEYRGRG